MNLVVMVSPAFSTNSLVSLLAWLLHSPARGLYELHMGWGLLEPLVHSHLGAIVSMLETLIKSHIE